MTLSTDNSIQLDGKMTGFYVTQDKDKTRVYSSINGQYKEHEMPHIRYSLSHNKPDSGIPGKSQFINDILRKLR